MDISIKLRIDKETDEKIDYCAEKLGITRSAALRKGIHDLYGKLQEK